MRQTVFLLAMSAALLGCGEDKPTEPELAPVTDSTWKQWHQDIFYREQTGVDEFTRRKVGTGSFSWRFTAFERDVFSYPCVSARSCDKVHGEYSLTLRSELDRDAMFNYSFLLLDDDSEFYSAFGSGNLGPIFIAAGNSAMVDGEFSFLVLEQDIPFIRPELATVWFSDSE